VDVYAFAGRACIPVRRRWSITVFTVNSKLMKKKKTPSNYYKIN
jgi:hypothetical protein